MAVKKNTLKKIELSATDPFLKYLAYMYNCGIDYITQSNDIIKNMEEYKNKLNEFTEEHKIRTILEEHLNKSGKNKKSKVTES